MINVESIFTEKEKNLITAIANATDKIKVAKVLVEVLKENYAVEGKDSSIDVGALYDMIYNLLNSIDIIQDAAAIGLDQEVTE